MKYGTSFACASDCETDYFSDTVFNNFFSIIESPAFILNSTGSIVFINQSMKKMLNLEELDILGNDWAIILDESEHKKAKLVLHQNNDLLTKNKIFTFLDSKKEAIDLHLQFIDIKYSDQELVIVICEVEEQCDNEILSFKKRFEIETVVCDLAAEILMLNSENIEQIILSCLEKIGNYSHDDHAYLYLCSEDELKIEKVFEWSRSGIPQREGRVDGISLSIIHNTKKIFKDKNDYISSCITFPPLSQLEYEYLQSKGIYSHLGIPIKTQNGTIGFLGVDSCQKNKVWDDQDHSVLRLTAKLFANSLLRFRAEKKIQTKDSQYRALIQNFCSGLVILFNKEIKLVLAEGKDSIFVNLGQPIKGKHFNDIFPPKRFPGLFGRAKKVFEGKNCSIEVECNNEWYEFRIAPLKNEYKEIQYGMIVLFSITERKKIELALKEAKAQQEQTAIAIQRCLLSSIIPKDIKNADFGLLSYPSLFVDGDFTDFIVYNDYTFDVILGDVMGKGIPAALIGASTKEAILRVVTSLITKLGATLPSVEKIMNTVQKEIGYRLENLSVFVTMIYCRINLKSRKLTYINAGHTPIYHLLINSSDIIHHDSTVTPIGLMNQLQMKESVATFEYNDRILFCSDGVLEARNDNNELFGEDRLHEYMLKTNRLSPKKAVDAIYYEVTKFTKFKELQDDFTCLEIDLHGENH